MASSTPPTAWPVGHNDSDSEDEHVSQAGPLRTLSRIFAGPFRERTILFLLQLLNSSLELLAAILACPQMKPTQNKCGTKKQKQIVTTWVWTTKAEHVWSKWTPKISSFLKPIWVGFLSLTSKRIPPKTPVERDYLHSSLSVSASSANTQRMKEPKSQ